MSKVRFGFVSNSSSSSFLITNTSDKTLTLEDFMRENIQLVDQFNQEYAWVGTFTHKEAILSAMAEDVIFSPDETQEVECGDHRDDGVFQQVAHQMMWDGGKSENWEWKFGESHH